MSMCTLHLFVYMRVCVCVCFPVCACLFCYPCSHGMRTHPFRVCIHINTWVSVCSASSTFVFLGVCLAMPSRWLPGPRGPTQHTRGTQGGMLLTTGGGTLQPSIRQSMLSPHTIKGGTDRSNRRRRPRRREQEKTGEMQTVDRERTRGNVHGYADIAILDYEIE